MFQSRWLGLIIVSCVFWFARQASAYPWMIRHEYTGCAQCHADPSGGGPLTAYGRAMGEVVLKTPYGRESVPEETEPGPGAKFLWGAIPLSDAFDLGGDIRVMQFAQKVADTPMTNRTIFMQADLTARLDVGRFVAAGSVGYQPHGALFAAVTRGPDHNMVSRQHWIGYRLDANSTMLIRAGRMNLPFGIRDVLHTLMVRSTTRTDINDAQQHGLSFSYSGAKIRAEIMGIFGNFQVRPDDYRERGYSGYFEWAPTTKLAVGVSSRIAHVELDSSLFRPMWRHAHGVFGRWSPAWKPLVLMAEADYVIDSPKERPRAEGIASMVQADLELFQGLHYQATGEISNVGSHGSIPTYATWLSLAWFLVSHTDLRLDAVWQSVATPVGRIGAVTLLAQAHLYL